MATTTDTSKLAPRILVNENDLFQKNTSKRVHPITLVFGFSPVGKTCEMVECNTKKEILREFGFPQTAPEKYFIDSALRVVEQGATALMTRLPYDNDQSHKVKYVDYKIENPLAMYDLATLPMEEKARQNDDYLVTILKEMNQLDSTMTQVQRISQVSDDYGEHIHTMTNEELVELELDPYANLDDGIFRIVDIKGEQYGIGASKLEYTGIFPVVVSAPMALYFRNRIENSEELDELFKLIDIEQGVEMSTEWFKQSDPVDENTKIAQSDIINSITQNINIQSNENKFHKGDSFQAKCIKQFPVINMLRQGKLEKNHLPEIGILVCKIGWDADQQITELSILESFVGRLWGEGWCIDRKINTYSQYIRMYKNTKISLETDFFVTSHQKITSLGMNSSECEKWINYKTSIIDPITYMLESVYSDVDSIQIDTILDAGLSSTAFAAYVARNQYGETFRTNEKIRTMVNWSGTEYSIDDQIEDYAYVWNQITRLFGDFIKTVRGDCVYIADGPRILNLERNYPIKNFTDLENIDLFNKYLPLFNGYTNNYVARYWNWIFIEDMQWLDQGFWIPASVAMGGQIALSDMQSNIWRAVAGQTNGIVDGAYNVSIKTKPYNEENDILYQNHWNFFNVFQNEGVVIEGQKTTQTKKTSLDRLNVRRMVCYIKQQLREIGNRYKYEPNTAAMRESFTKEVLDLLREIQRTSGISDYNVLCDNTNNTVETIDRHELHMKVAIKPIKAIEYIIIDLDVINGSSEMEENMVIIND